MYIKVGCKEVIITRTCLHDKVLEPVTAEACAHEKVFKLNLYPSGVSVSDACPRLAARYIHVELL